MGIKSWEANKLCIGGKVAEMALRLGASPFTLYKWMEPIPAEHGSGVKTDLDRIEHMIENSLILGNDFEDATAPIQYLNERFGIVGIRLPVLPANIADVTDCLLRTIKEFGELACATSEALADSKLKPHEAVHIETEAWQLIRQAALLIRAAKEAVDETC